MTTRRGVDCYCRGRGRLNGRRNGDRANDRGNIRSGRFWIRTRIAPKLRRAGGDARVNTTRETTTATAAARTGPRCDNGRTDSSGDRPAVILFLLLLLFFFFFSMQKANGKKFLKKTWIATTVGVVDRRGDGRCRFRRLSSNFLLESRLCYAGLRKEQYPGQKPSAVYFTTKIVSRNRKKK